MAKAELPILIAGGGIGGFAAALALTQKGFAVQLLERAADFHEVGAGIQLGPNVFRMFELLGVGEQMSHWAVFPQNLIMRDALDGSEITRIPAGARLHKHFGYPYAVIHRADLHNTLIEAVRRSPLATLSTGSKLVAYEDRGDRVVLSTEGGKTFEGAALIGADGLWSAVRSQLVGDGKPRVSGHIAYRGVIPLAKVPEHLREDNVVLWAGPKTHLVHYPLHRGEVYNLVVVFHSSRYEEGWDSYGDPSELRQRFAGQHPKVREFLAMANEWKMWVLCDRDPISQWTRGRVTLLGDAAHPMLQYLAQGGCMAIEDAVVLADRLAASKGDVNGAFLAYQQARYLRTTRVQLTARMYGNIYHAADAVRDLRRQMLAGRTAEQAYNGVAWLYTPVA
jgi:salicylate hydroxylase